MKHDRYKPESVSSLVCIGPLAAADDLRQSVRMSPVRVEWGPVIDSPKACDSIDHVILVAPGESHVPLRERPISPGKSENRENAKAHMQDDPPARVAKRACLERIQSNPGTSGKIQHNRPDRMPSKHAQQQSSAGSNFISLRYPQMGWLSIAGCRKSTKIALFC